LLSQSGKEEKIFCEDGSQRLYHNVAKNSVFSFVIGQTTCNAPGYSPIDFTSLGVLCSLVYDQNRKKPVEVISQKPMEYKLSCTQDGSELRVDARIKVLSSQFQGSLFCIFVQFVDANKKIIPELSVYSQPVRVRSKIKPVSSLGGIVADTPSSSVCSPQKRAPSHLLGMPALKRGRKVNSPDSNSPVIKSESFDDDGGDISSISRILQTLARIETRQIEQQTFMENLSLNKRISSRSASSLSGDSPDHTPSDFNAAHLVSSELLSTSNLEGTPVNTNEQCFQHPSVVKQDDSFSEQFLRLMTTFSVMSDTEKQQQLSIIQSYANERQHHAMVSLMNSFLQPNQQVSSSSFDVDDDCDTFGPPMY